MIDKIIVLIFCFWPTVYEAFDDRYGERKKDKLIDGLVLIVAAICISALCWFVLDYNPLSVLLLLLAVRFAFFDYIVNLFLKKYSPGHSDINVFSYTGTVAFTDRLTAKIPPVLRFALRAVVFGLAVWWYLGSNH